jgi:pimeloyl-ACP methyl ester carboxylesterase
LKKHPVRFEDRLGRTLKGVMVEPETGPSNREMGFVYLPGVVLGVTAVHGIGLKLAGRLAERGVSTALIDPPGVGESEGDFPEGRHEDISEFIAEGSLVEGCIDIVNWMTEHVGLRRVALIGHCGGALTGVECTARHDAVKGALMICPPPLRRKRGEREIERPEIAEQYFKGYSRNLFSPASWKKLVSGETDYRTLLTVLRSKTGRLAWSAFGRRSGPDERESAADDRNFNLKLVEAMKRSVEQGKTVWVAYGERDIEINNYRDLHRMHVNFGIPLTIIEDTSHGFTTAEGQARLLDLALAFAQQLQSENS